MAALSTLMIGALSVGLTLGLSAQAQAEPHRIVSVGGDVTEIVYALGHGDEVVATDSTSVYPPEALHTPKVGYVRELAAESVLSMNPTVLFLGGAAGPETVVDQLQSTGLNIVQMEINYSLDAVREKVRRVAEALGEEDAGAELIAEIDQHWNDTLAEISTIEGEPRGLFFASLGDAGPQAAGQGTAAHAVMTLLGVENAFGDQQGYRALSVEAALVADPDVIFVMSHNVDALGGLDAVASHPALALTRAGQSGHIIAVDSVRVMSFGPRIAEGMSQAARELSAMMQDES